MNAVQIGSGELAAGAVGPPGPGMLMWIERGRAAAAPRPVAWTSTSR
ncbi:hypothetical protein NLX83_22420 [Allokutzneria sp. A3M-2-11 16]|nr:hypothetical protein [Allokutzneria sp. A3M-2-11 16]MCP3802025.1 hypothetical protein [Allokutzneria sp. A3M-2-11 16]